DPGVVVVRGGVIEAVGPVGSTRVPADASAVDTTGKVVYAAFVDPYVTVDRLAGKSPKKPPGGGEAGTQGPRERGPRATQPAGRPVRAEARAADGLVVKDSVADTYRRLGFAVVAAVPTSGVMRGRGAVVSLSDAPLSVRVIDPQNGQFVSLEPP